MALRLETFGLRVPARETATFRKMLKGCEMRRANVNPVQPDPEAAARRVLLVSTEHKDVDALLAAMDVKDADALQAALDGGTADVVAPFVINLGYDALSLAECLRQLIPPDNVPDADLQGGSFELVGRVAHVNLRENMLPYKHVFGEVLADKNARVEVVVNKTSATKNEFRVFPMEVLYGPPSIGDDGELSLVTEVKQGAFTFELDYARVYWNSRLEREHARICDTYLLRAPARGGSTVLADLYCGIGPFVVPAASSDGPKGGCNCVVYANDLNPDSVKWLRANVRRNKCSANVVDTSVDDAVLYARKLVRRGVRFDHAIMNLPALAVDHLAPAFQGLLNFDELAEDIGDAGARAAADAWEGWDADPPWIHVYCFVRGNTSSGGRGDGTGRAAAELEAAHTRDAKRLVMHRLHLGTRGDAESGEPAAKRRRAPKYADTEFEAIYDEGDLASIDAAAESRFRCDAHVVRNVAPGKVMVCVSFPLPPEVARRPSPADVRARLHAAAEEVTL